MEAAVRARAQQVEIAAPAVETLPRARAQQVQIAAPVLEALLRARAQQVQNNAGAKSWYPTRPNPRPSDEPVVRHNNRVVELTLAHDYPHLVESWRGFVEPIEFRPSDAMTHASASLRNLIRELLKLAAPRESIYASGAADPLTRKGMSEDNKIFLSVQISYVRDSLITKRLEIRFVDRPEVLELTGFVNVPLHTLDVKRIEERFSEIQEYAPELIMDLISAARLHNR